MMENIQMLLILGFYIFGAVYFAVISKKCFIANAPARKTVASVFLSPSVGYFLSFIVTSVLDTVFFSESDLFDSNAFLTVYALISTAVQLTIQLVFMFLYIRLMNTKNPSIEMFVYLCSIMLVPSLIYLIVLSDAAGFVVLFLYLALHIIFYKMAVIPLTYITGTKQQTNKKLFITMPGISFLFNTVIYVLVMYSFKVTDFGAETGKMLEDLKGFDNEIIQSSRALLIKLLNFYGFQTSLMILPSVFVTVIVIISFSIIVSNIKYMNETLAAKDEIKTLSVEVMEALAHTIDAKDEYTRGHSIRVAKYSRMIAEKMKLSPEQCENIYYMGLLHDIGKIGVPNEIINKPAPLTDEEYEVIKTHPGTGYDILSEIKSRPDLAIGAHWHHERYDGKGYPDHKSGDQIPLEARIIAVADCYDAMTSNRSYRKYLAQENVRAELERAKGSQLDEKPVEAMISLIDADTDYKMHE